MDILDPGQQTVNPNRFLWRQPVTHTPVDIDALKKTSNPIRAITEHYQLDAAYTYMIADSFLPRHAGQRSAAHHGAFSACKATLGPAHDHFEYAVKTLVAFHRTK